MSSTPTLFVTFQESLANFTFSNRLLIEFQKRIPLRHCQWNNVIGSLPSLASRSWKAVDQLSFELISFDEYTRAASNLPKDSNLPIFSKAFPILHMLIVMGDDPEIYKNSTKNSIKSWIASLSNVGNGTSLEWFIIHVTNQEIPKTGLKSILSSSVFVRLNVAVSIVFNRYM